MRRVTWSRVAFMAGLIAVGLALVHFANTGGRNVSKEQAIAIARTKIDFEPSDYRIRFIRQGIPPRGVWAVSYFIEEPTGGHKRITVVLIDASTGKVTDVQRVK